MRNGGVVRGSSNILLGIVKHQIFDVHELAGDPHAGDCFIEVCTLDEPQSDWTASHHSSRRASRSSAVAIFGRSISRGKMPIS